MADCALVIGSRFFDVVRVDSCFVCPSLLENGLSAVGFRRSSPESLVACVRSCPAQLSPLCPKLLESGLRNINTWLFAPRFAVVRAKASYGPTSLFLYSGSVSWTRVSLFWTMSPLAYLLRSDQVSGLKVVLPVLDLGEVGSVFSAQSRTLMGLAFPIFALSRLEFLLLVFDSSQLGFLMLLHSLAWVGLSLLFFGMTWSNSSVIRVWYGWSWLSDTDKVILTFRFCPVDFGLFAPCIASVFEIFCLLRVTLFTLFMRRTWALTFRARCVHVRIFIAPEILRATRLSSASHGLLAPWIRLIGALSHTLWLRHVDFGHVAVGTDFVRQILGPNGLCLPDVRSWKHWKFSIHLGLCTHWLLHLPPKLFVN